jgi:hypothetical protein
MLAANIERGIVPGIGKVQIQLRERRTISFDPNLEVVCQCLLDAVLERHPQCFLARGGIPYQAREE